MRTLTRAELLGSVVSGVEVSCVWSKELQSLLKERDALLEEVTMLRLAVAEKEHKIEALTRVTEDFTFVRLYA